MPEVPATSNELIAMNNTLSRLKASWDETELNEALDFVEWAIDGLYCYHVAMAEDSDVAVSKRALNHEADALYKAKKILQSIDRICDECGSQTV
jgi:hypothetical protein